MNEIHPDRFDLNLLRVFEAVYQERNLLRAASVLFVTPSAVSHSIRRLRDQLGEPLFERRGRKMEPTPACERMAPLLLEQLGQLRQIVRHWGKFDPVGTTQLFKIGIPEAIEPVVLATIASAVRRQAPAARLATVALDRRKLAASLASPALDIAIDVTLPVDEPVRHRSFSTDEFCVIADEGAVGPGNLDLSRYLSAEHISVTTRSPGPAVEDLQLLHLGLRRKIAIHCLTYQGALGLLPGSPYLLTMPRQLSRHLVQSETLREFAVPADLGSVGLHLYWHASKDSDPANAWLRDLVSSLSF